MQKPYIIGITGGSGSGKTTFIRELMKFFNDKEVSLVSQDNYYKERHLQPLDDDGIENFDSEKSIDIDLFIDDMTKLMNGKNIEKTEYNFNNPNKDPKKIIIYPSPVIIMEGVLLFYFPQVRNMIDLKIFIDVKEHVRFKRRILRDTAERGYPLEEILMRVEKHVEPAYKKYIQPFRDSADIIIPNNHSFDKALEVINNQIKFKTQPQKV
ncbi:MAG: uridine kinase [Bacteroidetes bacterium]|nr:uridine kinase [Bacteroidota bacterium]